jgi:hypothetical protein
MFGEQVLRVHIQANKVSNDRFRDVPPVVRVTDTTLFTFQERHEGHDIEPIRELGVVRVAEKLLEGNIGHGLEGEKIGIVDTAFTVAEAGPPELEGPTDEKPAEVFLDLRGGMVPGE